MQSFWVRTAAHLGNEFTEFKENMDKHFIELEITMTIIQENINVHLNENMKFEN